MKLITNPFKQAAQAYGIISKVPGVIGPLDGILLFVLIVPSGPFGDYFADHWTASRYSSWFHENWAVFVMVPLLLFIAGFASGRQLSRPEAVDRRRSLPMSFWVVPAAIAIQPTVSTGLILLFTTPFMCFLSKISTFNWHDHTFEATLPIHVQFVLPLLAIVPAACCFRLLGALSGMRQYWQFGVALSAFVIAASACAFTISTPGLALLSAVMVFVVLALWAGACCTPILNDKPKRTLLSVGTLVRTAFVYVGALLALTLSVGLIINKCANSYWPALDVPDRGYGISRKGVIASFTPRTLPDASIAAPGSAAFMNTQLTLSDKPASQHLHNFLNSDARCVLNDKSPLGAGEYEARSADPHGSPNLYYDAYSGLIGIYAPVQLWWQGAVGPHGIDYGRDPKHIPSQECLP